MKPHRLTLEAFGPYVNPVTIEFDELARDGLFLIHGPTGAGKTYLLRRDELRALRRGRG